MPQLMLPRTWPGNFRRTVAGEVVEFAPGQATEVTDEQYAALIENGDVGSALLPATNDEKGRVRVDQETLDTIKAAQAEDAESGSESDSSAEGEGQAPPPRRSRRSRNR